MMPQYWPASSQSIQPSPANSSPIGPNSNVRPRVIPPSARKHFKENPEIKNKVFKPTNIQPQGQPVLEELTPEEGQKLLEVWRTTNFIEFNAWCQIANARLYYKVNENSDEANKKIVKSFLCTLTLSFKERPGVTPVNQLGFGKNKKSAKKDAIEKCVIELIQSGKVIFGLRNKKFLEKAARLQAQGRLGVTKEEYTKPPIKEKSNVQKISHKLSKKMQNFLKNDRFTDGCTMIASILNKKKADWNEISFIWSYALLKHNILMVYALMEIIFEGKPATQALNPSQAMNFLPCHPDPIKRSNEEKVHKDLVSYYCTSRFKANNPYDLLDICNHDLNNLELDPSAKMANDDENGSRLIEDPYSNTTNGFVTLDDGALNYKHDPQYGQSITQSLSNSMLQMSLVQMGTDFTTEGSQVDISTPNNCRITHNLLEEMYETLFFQGDLTFCLHVAEKMYSMARLDSEKFTSYQAAQYYSNKKNIIFIEQIEQMFQIFMKPINRDVDYYTSVKGIIQKIGNKFSYEVLVFIPQEPECLVNSKILKKSVQDPPDPLHMIQLDDFVLLTSCYSYLESEPTNPNPDSPLTMYLNQYALNPNKIKENQNFVQCIKDTHSSIEYSLIGCIKDVEKDSRLKIFVLPNRQQSDAIKEQNRVWRVTRLVNRYNYDVYSDSIIKFSTKNSTSPMLMQIILANPNYINTTALQQMAEAKIVGDRKEVPTNLNESQNAALRAACTQLLSLIHGPPGTGKTILSVEIILDWLRNNDEQVLVCTPNNLQLDILHSELVKANVVAERVGPSYDDKIDAYNMQKIKNSKNPTFNIPNLKFVLAKRMLSQAHVICATCEGLGSPYLKNLKFTRVLIDGASQITEIACISSLMRDCQQLVLIGDHRQPGPKVHSIFAESKGLRLSLFERLIKQGIKTQLLDIQYKMHPSLSLFPILNFYANSIKDGVNPENRPLVPGFQWPNPHLRVAFINVKGPEQNYAASIQNTNETQVIVFALMHILKNFNLRSYNIGILTPYEAQKRRIKSEIFHQATKFPNLFGLSIDELQHITKNTQIIDIEIVDVNQMLEKELVFISTVRSNTKGMIGVLKDIRQMNVMLTKARRGLIVVGDGDTLRNDIIWREWLDWIRINKAEINYHKS